MRKENENGAIVVEATISLSVFIFVIFTILSIVNICYIQAKMSTALDTAAREISQYSYLYFKGEFDKKVGSMMAAGTDAGAKVDTIAKGVGDFIDAFKKGDMSNTINQGKESYDSIKGSIDEIVKDPKAFALGVAKGGLAALIGDGQNAATRELAKAFLKKHLSDFEGDTPEAFLKRYRVVDGESGLNFNSTYIKFATANGEGVGRIKLVLTYKVQVIQLLNIDIKMTFRNYSATDAWGCENSKIAGGAKSAAILPPRRRLLT